MACFLSWEKIVLKQTCFISTWTYHMAYKASDFCQSIHQVFLNISPLKTNQLISPQNGCLEDELSFFRWSVDSRGSCSASSHRLRGVGDAVTAATAAAVAVRDQRHGEFMGVGSDMGAVTKIMASQCAQPPVFGSQGDTYPARSIHS